MGRAELTTTQGKAREIIAAAIQNDPRLVSRHTVRGYQRDLDAFEEWRAGRPLTKLLVEAYAAHLQKEGKSRHTVNRALSAITNAIRRGGTPLQVQALPGHSSFDTTLGYFHAGARTANPAEDLIEYGD